MKILLGGGCTDSEKEFNSTEPFRLFSKFRTSKLDAEEELPKNKMNPVMDVQVVIRKAEKAAAEATVASAAHKIPFIKKTSNEEEAASVAATLSSGAAKTTSTTSVSKCEKPAVIKNEASSSRAKMEAKPDATAVKAIKKENLESKYSTPNRLVYASEMRWILPGLVEE